VIAVLVAARDEAARVRLEAAVTGARGLRLVAGPPGALLARQVALAQPDVAVVDLEAARIAGLAAALGEAAGIALVVLTEAPARVLRETTASRDLVRAVLPRDATAAEIRAAVEAVATGLIALHPDALDAAGRGAPLPVTGRAEPDQPLTDRELEVLTMMADGLGNKIIAARLGISSHTAKFHVASIMAKLGAGSRTEAVAIGMRRGLVAI
jgi:DNA-binding NarL/FixJ family response regulator